MANYHFVYKDVEGASTQWDNIQRKLGNLLPKPPAFKPPSFKPATATATTTDDYDYLTVSKGLCYYISSGTGTFFCAWYASQKHWLANNILSLAFCIQGIEMLSLGSFKTGAILLSPQQPTNVECEFYVMRYMKDLIRDQSILRKQNFNGKKTYTETELDEVRAEWINFVLKNMS